MSFSGVDHLGRKPMDPYRAKIDTNVLVAARSYRIGFQSSFTLPNHYCDESYGDTMPQSTPIIVQNRAKVNRVVYCTATNDVALTSAGAAGRQVSDNLIVSYHVQQATAHSPQDTFRHPFSVFGNLSVDLQQHKGDQCGIQLDQHCILIAS